MSTEEQNRLISGLRKIKRKWIVSTALEGAMIAVAYGILMLQVVRDKAVMSSIRQALVDHGLDYTSYELIAVFSECSILVLCVSFIWRRRILRQIRRGLAWRAPRYPPERALSRYDRSVTVSSLLVFLIPVAGLPLLLFTGGATGALATVIALWALGLFLIAYTNRDLLELPALGNERAVPGDSPGASESGLELECGGITFGLWESERISFTHLRLRGGSLVAKPDELQIRSVWWGNYTLPADQVVAFHVVDSHWLSGLHVRIEHQAQNVPAAIFLTFFDCEPDEFFREIASAGFVPRGSRSKDAPQRGFLSNWLPW